MNAASRKELLQWVLAALIVAASITLWKASTSVVAKADAIECNGGGEVDSF